MKLKTLIAESRACRTTEDAHALLWKLVKAFAESPSLKSLENMNREATMEDAGSPLVNFELNRVLSNDYITTIQPEIRNHELTIRISTNRMLDRAGMCSKKWDLAGEDFEDSITDSANIDSTELAKAAMSVAINHHRMLIESVGIPYKLAVNLAESSWKGEASC